MHHRKISALFIVGVPRSGTTLLRLMIDSHPEVAVPPETHFLPSLMNQCPRSDKPAERFIQILTSSPRWPDWHVDQNALENAVKKLTPFSLDRAVQAFYRLYAARFGKTRWGDKTPGYLMHMKAIQQLLPEARFIHVIRDGRDVCLSIRDLWWGPDTVEQAALWWKKRIELAGKQARALPHYKEVFFEDLVCEPEKTLKQICAFTGIDWDPAMLKYYATADRRIQELDHEVRQGDIKISPARRRAIFSKVSSPPDMSRVHRWQTELSSEAHAVFLENAADMLRKLGYPLERRSVAQERKKGITV